MTKPESRTIQVKTLTRVEGEGALDVVVHADSTIDAKLSIYEPPRFFEGLLRGRPLEDAPDITSRICGICPVAYQMTAVHALESALQVEITEPIRRLRRLFYCAEWIESHCVHMHLLHIPDFFDCENTLELATKFPDEVAQGLNQKRLGNRLLEIIGGRAVNPINVAVGGFYRAPDRKDLQALLPELRQALQDAISIAKWVAGFEYPDFAQTYEMVALQHDSEYPMNAGKICSTTNPSIQVDTFEEHFDERQVPHSTALHCVRLPNESSYLVGPLARVNLNFDKLGPTAKSLSDQLGLVWPCFNPYKSLIARALEVVQAFDESIALIESLEDCSPSRIRYESRAGEGCWATEAPRGMIYHRYRVSDDGLIEHAKIVPPTSQNQYQIEQDLKAAIAQHLELDDAALGMHCERLIRSYDPCISCATHFLKFSIRRQQD